MTPASATLLLSIALSNPFAYSGIAGAQDAAPTATSTADEGDADLVRPDESPKEIAATDDARLAALRATLERGLARGASVEDRASALDAIDAIERDDELRFAVHHLTGGGPNPNRIAKDRELRARLFVRLSRDPSYGQPLLVRTAVRGNEVMRALASDALPAALSRESQEELRRFVASDRELFINRAASLASAHGAAGLIPALIDAQFVPERQRRGDEAWIALGKSTTYIRGLEPVVGDASGAFQPIPGVLFEGSVFRVMESSVTIYRTEVHLALVDLVEDETGAAAPPFGYDLARWSDWYRHEYPKLVDARRARLDLDRRSREVETAPVTDDK